MSRNNQSQDTEYEGPPYHEVKFHQTHFQMRRKLKTHRHPKDDPDWEYIGVGRWRKISKKRDEADEESEVTSDDT